MNKLILSTLLVAGVVCAKEHCEPSLVSTGDYKQYHFTCHKNNGYLAEFDFFIDDDEFYGMEINYFKNGIKYKKSVVFFDTEDTSYVYKGYTREFDEYGVVVYGKTRMGKPKDGYMIILSFWNKVKKYIKYIKNEEIQKEEVENDEPTIDEVENDEKPKEQTKQTKAKSNYTPEGGWYCDVHECN